MVLYAAPFQQRLRDLGYWHLVTPLSPHEPSNLHRQRRKELGRHVHYLSLGHVCYLNSLCIGLRISYAQRLGKVGEVYSVSIQCLCQKEVLQFEQSK